MDDDFPSSCEHCIFFHVPRGGIQNPPNSGHTGRCRRNSPGPYTGLESNRTFWPVVRRDDWCGQGSRRT